MFVFSFLSRLRSLQCTAPAYLLTERDVEVESGLDRLNWNYKPVTELRQNTTQSCGVTQIFTRQ